MLTEYSGNISGPVETGQVFVIAGKTIDAANRFHLHLTNGKHRDYDIHLGLTVKFREDSIIRYSRFDMQWSEEEDSENLSQEISTNPIVCGEFFKIYILVGDDRFHIAINDRAYCIYKFIEGRDKLDIHTIILTGDIQIVSQVDHRRIFPKLMPGIQFDDKKQVFSSDTPRLFTPGHVIVITGIPSGNRNGMFTVKFFEGPTKKQALHFNARFQLKIVVLNSMTDALEWRKDEERTSSFPFLVDQQFKLAIAITPTEFRIAVDGNRFVNYNYRSENLLNVLTGFKISTENGMRMEITTVDHHMMLTPYCDDFQELCSYNQ